MQADRLKWEARYRSGQRPHDGPPSRLLRRWLPLLRRGRALDVATGLGRNAIFLAQQGYNVDAVDIAPIGLAEAARRARRARVRVRWIEADLDDYAVPVARYALVLNAFFLKRRLIPVLRRAVRPGGVCVIETHLQGDEAGGPRGKAHRLRRGELLRWFRGWEILEVGEGLFVEDGRPRLLGRIVARRPVAGRGRPRARVTKDRARRRRPPRVRA
jgi:SAM-dependent methyltransferase